MNFYPATVLSTFSPSVLQQSLSRPLLNPKNIKACTYKQQNPNIQNSTLKCLIYQFSLAFPTLEVFGLFTLFSAQRVKHWKKLLIQGGCGTSVLGNNKILTRHGRKQPPPTGAALRLEWIIPKAPSNFSYCMILWLWYLYQQR